MRTRIIAASDIHWCHIDWYGVSTEERMERFVQHLEEEYKKEPFEVLLLLGDYSLDHWDWGIKGCYINEGFSYTKKFAEFIVPRIKKLGVQLAMIPGNHEQYGNKLWNELTGYHRQDYVVCDEYIFILLDTYAANLDPTEHSDGTYSGVDVDYINKIIAEYPEHRVVLCAHHFEAEAESDEFKALVRENDNILCLVSGHVHQSNVIELDESWGRKALFLTGNYSYKAEDGILLPMWGFRELILSDNTLQTRYITPDNTVVREEQIVHQEYEYHDEYKIFFNKRK